MSIKKESELRGLQRAGRVVALTLAAMEAKIAEGITTAELDDVARRHLESHGARATPKDSLGFPGFSCISVNDEAVHGIPGNRTLHRDDIVKIDVTADLDGFVADAARTVIVSPRNSDRQRLAFCAKSAFRAGLASAVPGKRACDIGSSIEREVKHCGFRVIKQLCGHGVGRRMHEPPSIPNYFEPRMAHRLTPGLVITVEPIICAGSGRAYQANDGWTVRTTDGSLAAHHEETIVITQNAPLILTALHA